MQLDLVRAVQRRLQQAQRVPVGLLRDDPTAAIGLEYLTPMLLIPFFFFVQLGRIPKSTKAWREEARSKGWLVEYRREDGKIVIFISQTWWDREYLDPDRDPNDKYDVGGPDWQKDYPAYQREVDVEVEGKWVKQKEAHTRERPKDLKWRIIVAGVERLIEDKGLEAENVMIWCDWQSIYQDDPATKWKGVESLIKYATLCSYMLVPVDEAKLEWAQEQYPQNIPNYGERGW